MLSITYVDIAQIYDIQTIHLLGSTSTINVLTSYQDARQLTDPCHAFGRHDCICSVWKSLTCSSHSMGKEVLNWVLESFDQCDSWCMVHPWIVTTNEGQISACTHVFNSVCLILQVSPLSLVKGNHHSVIPFVKSKIDTLQCPPYLILKLRKQLLIVSEMRACFETFNWHHQLDHWRCTFKFPLNLVVL